MKFKILAFALSMIMLLGLFAGCTPKTQETEASYTLPGVETGADKLPENETGQADPTQPGKEPIASESDPNTPAIETGKLDEPVPEEPSSEERPTEPAAQQSDPEEDEGGLEIESEYTFEIGGDLGVGGN